ncbi:MAG: GNAT family N-acetyltransferase [Oscillospiraceae bacterium]|nr:GNAT family N-acetyltransferase [Oscillospiraceae bacterium]MBQ9148217.1 GNAT family N-acetyltransferase [Oscillospiraceae bacterium]
MNIVYANDALIPGLRQLWTAAFGDTDAFLDGFFRTAYAPHRCRCVLENGAPVSVLYWFDCQVEDSRLAYVYAVATDPAHRGKDLCKTLMADTMELLNAQGYDGVALLPQEEWLINMYKGMGFAPCTTVTETHLMAAEEPIPFRKIDVTEYAALRRQLLPPGGVIQEGENLAFLAFQAELYAGDGWLAAAMEVDGMLWCPEFLGNPDHAPGLVKALGFREGSFRMPGDGRSFAMFHPLANDCTLPKYFGLTFD